MEYPDDIEDLAGTRMSRLKVAAFLLTFVLACALGQRHSGDTEQGYFAKTSNPILNINDQTIKTWSHPRLSDLMNMPKTIVEVPDDKTKQTDSYQGVGLGELVPHPSGLRVDVFRENWAFGDKLAVSTVDLDMHSEVVVACAKNGKRLGTDHPFCLIAKDNHGAG
jgi:hypothetical protein